MMQACAFWIEEPGHGELRMETLPERGADEVLVRAFYSAVSRGSESLVFHGAVPESEWSRMRAPFQEGDFPGPVKYGYANVGVVEAGPPELQGQTVFCLYPHQDRYVVPAEAVIPLPDGLPPARAILAANMETAVNGLWDAGPRPGDRIAVIGAGVVGCLVAALAVAIPGTRVQLIDTDTAKADTAKALGVAFANPEETLEEAAGEADLVIHASGNPAGLRTALDLAGTEATVLEMSWFGAQEVSLPLGAAFHAKRLTLASSQVGMVSPARRARWSHRRRLALALSLLREPRFDALISGESPFEALPRTMARLADSPRATFCHRIAYGTEG